MLNYKYDDVTVKQINKMCHATGLRKDRIKYRKCISYRNYFSTGPGGDDVKLLDVLVELGLMRKRPDHLDELDKGWIYHVTEKGFKFLSETLGIKIIKGD